MASIFMPFSMADHHFARELESKLRERGHEPRLGAGTPIVGDWRSKLIRWLKESDVLLPLMSEDGYSSNYVASEIGMARAFSQTRDMLVLPVVVGGEDRFDIFIQDYHCLRHDPAVEGSADLVERISAAIEQWENETPASPRVFVSHRHAERDLAKQLVHVLKTAFEISEGDLRCTSVPPYKLNAGIRTSETLRSEISEAEVVIGVISPVAADSKYVLAELGAAWGLGVPTFPLRVKGAGFEHIPEPLNERHSLDLGDPADCAQFVDDIADVTSLQRRKRATDLIGEIEGLRAAATKPAKKKRK